jgi:sugar lactone lactonase YvrE
VRRPAESLPAQPAVNAKLCAPGALVLDQSGNLYFRDCNRIKKIDPAGNLSTVVYTAVVFATTNAPALDAQGNLYYADQGGTRVVRLGPDAKTTVIAGGNGTGTTGDGGLATQALLECAGSVALDRQGNVYFSQGCNTGFDRVRVVTPDGIINSFAGGSPWRALLRRRRRPGARRRVLRSAQRCRGRLG